MGAVGILCTLNIEDRVHCIGRRVFSCRVSKHKAGLGKRCISCYGVLKADSDNRVLTCNNGAARRNIFNSYRAVRLRNTVHKGRIREDLTIAGNTVNDQLTCSSIRADTDSCIVDDQSLDRRSNVTREGSAGSHGHRAVGSIKLAVNVQSSSLNITIGRRSCSRLTGSSNRSLRNAGGKLSALTNGQSVYIDECIRLKISTTQSLGNCQNTVISNSEGGAASTSFLQNCTNLCTAVGRTRGRERTAGGKNNTLNSRLGTAHRRDEVAGTVKCQSCAGNLGGIDVRRSLQLAVGTGGREASCGHTGNSSLAERIAGNTCQFGGHIAELNFAVCNCIRNGQRTEIQETVAAVGLLNFALNVSNYIHRRGNTGQIRKNQFAVVGDGTGIIGRTRIEGRTRCTDLEPKSSRSSFNRTAIFDLELRTTIRRQFGIDDELTGACDVDRTVIGIQRLDGVLTAANAQSGVLQRSERISRIFAGRDRQLSPFELNITRKGLVSNRQGTACKGHIATRQKQLVKRTVNRFIQVRIELGEIKGTALIHCSRTNGIRRIGHLRADIAAVVNGERCGLNQTFVAVNELTGNFDVADRGVGTGLALSTSNSTGIGQISTGLHFKLCAGLQRNSTAVGRTGTGHAEGSARGDSCRTGVGNRINGNGTAVHIEDPGRRNFLSTVLNSRFGLERAENRKGTAIGLVKGRAGTNRHILLHFSNGARGHIHGTVTGRGQRTACELFIRSSLILILVFFCPQRNGLNIKLAVLFNCQLSTGTGRRAAVDREGPHVDSGAALNRQNRPNITGLCTGSIGRLRINIRLGFVIDGTKTGGHIDRTAGNIDCTDKTFQRAVQIDRACTVNLQCVTAVGRRNGIKTCRLSSTRFADRKGGVGSRIKRQRGVTLQVGKTAHVFITVTESRSAAANGRLTLAGLVACVGQIARCLQLQSRTARAGTP